jgi:Raf kinase inhibitor-like YbhB/YbcL family protein
MRYSAASFHLKTNFPERFVNVNVATLGGVLMPLTLNSPEFAAGAAIPTRCTYEGIDASPALAWSGAPADTRAFALIVDDPDAPDPAAPRMTYVHWVLYDLPASATGLAAGASNALPAGTRVGLNDWGRPDYGGPCPPIGRHRYFFKLYALGALLGDLGAHATKATVEKAMHGHVLAEASLMGTYQKAR